MRLNEKYTEYFSVGEEGGKIYAELICSACLVIVISWVMLRTKHKTHTLQKSSKQTSIKSLLYLIHNLN